MIKSNGIKGFTLLEMLIALALLGMIMTLVTGSYYASARAKRNMENRLELVAMGRRALDVMIKEIDGAYIDSNDTDIPPFLGENGGSLTDPKDTLLFYTTAFDSRALGAGGNLAEIEYELKEDTENKGSYFLMKRADPFPDREPKDGGIVFDAAEQVLGLKLEYQDDNGVLGNRWDSSVSNALPRLVHITLMLKGKDGAIVNLDGYAAPMRWK